ncbi:MAG TPA: glutathione S-transferase family protein [Xanthobacteraceae bacterium]|jgi:glutathione S-transferase
MALRLIVGNKNYSSWSFRPWLAMKVAQIPFEDEVIALDASDFEARLAAFSGSGKVPLLVDGSVHVWESLAILEYVAEKFPDAKLWPEHFAARARARAIAAEMHAGFVPLRRHLPMNMRRPVRSRELTPEAHSNIRRIEAIWTDCRSQFGRNGMFLFGNFGAADAMYAPVVSRLHTYDVPIGAVCRAYMDAMMALPAWSEWQAAALAETGLLPQDEVDWPLVLTA